MPSPPKSNHRPDGARADDEGAASQARRAPRRRLSPDQRRKQLIGIVEDLFRSRPYEELGVPDVARQAGVTQGLVYHYFPTKEALFLAAFRDRADELLRRCLPALDAPLPVLVERAVGGYLDFVEERRVVYLNLFRGTTASEPVVHRLCEETRFRIVDHFMASLGVGPHELPAMRLSLRGYIGYAESVILEWIERAHGDTPRSTVEKLLYAAILGAIRGGLSCEATPPLGPEALDALEREYRAYFGI